MKAEYCVEPTVGVHIDPASAMPDKMPLDNADVCIEVGSDNLLKKVTVIYTGLPIKLIEKKESKGKRTVINPSYPDVNNRAFNVMRFIYNYIQVQTGRTALDIDKLTQIEPTISPETREEEEHWNNCNKIYETIYCSGIESVGVVSFDQLTKQFNHANAYANFTDAKNTDDPISKYERLYKVVESFFNGRGDQFDQNVADFMVDFDTNFVPDHFGVLRKLRNRCIHSKDNRHVTSGDLDLLGEVTAATAKLERIADLLLKHK
ncbi:hypothetical protein [Candidatus Electrothrix sp.]|uniref:hypothetical protein n=1 Tax=Candidatus Electrothrix sp. TaxID=2170559 RepID=UPI0040570653